VRISNYYQLDTGENSRKPVTPIKKRNPNVIMIIPLRIEIFGVFTLIQSTRANDKLIKTPFNMRTIFSSTLNTEMKMLTMGMTVPNIRINSGMEVFILRIIKLFFL
jgi:hypothetical protein